MKTKLIILGIMLKLAIAREENSEDETFKECATATRPVENIKITVKEADVPNFSEEIVPFVGSLSGYWGTVTVMKLQVNSLYCYEGGNGDGNTGCIPHEHVFKLGKAEIRESMEEMKCMVGEICAPEGNCWGSDSYHCLAPLLYERKTKVSPDNLNGEVTPFKRFAYHTCTKNYYCDLQQYKLPIKATTKDGQEVKFEVQVPGKGVYELSAEEELLMTSSDGYQILLPKITVEPVEGKLGCIVSSEKGDRSCIILEGPKKNEVVEMDHRCIVGKDNLFLSATCRRHSSEQEPTVLFMNKNEDGTSASIRDVREAIKVLHYNDQKSSFNLAKTTIQINLIKRTIKEMIITSSARDNRYLGLLMGIPSFSEKQQDGTFTIRGCSEPTTNLTCTTHFNYQNGIWKPKKIETPCDHKPDPEAKRIEEDHELILFPEEELIFNEAQVSKLNGAINEKKKVMRFNGLMGYHDLNGESSTLDAISSVTDYMNPWSIFYRHATFILALSSFVMCVLLCIRR